MKRPRKDYCLASSFGDFADEIAKKYGARRGKVICPDCGRIITIRKGNGVAYSVVPAHLKEENLK